MRVSVSPSASAARLACGARESANSVTRCVPVCANSLKRGWSRTLGVFRLSDDTSGARRKDEVFSRASGESFGTIAEGSGGNVVSNADEEVLPPYDPITDALRVITERGTPLALFGYEANGREKGGRGWEGEKTNRSGDGDDETQKQKTKNDVTVAEHVSYVLHPGLGVNGEALLTVSGKKNYQSLMRRFVGTEDRELSNCSRTILRSSRISNREAIVKWETTFVPEKVQWMVKLANALPDVTVVYYDVLDRIGVRSQFKWRGLWVLFKTVVTKRELRVPVGKIRGVATLTFSLGEEENSNKDDNDDKDKPVVQLIKHEETIDLVRSVNDKTCQNRMIAKHLLVFLDQRKPADTSLEKWDETIDACIKWRSVPGMGQFAIDGLEDGDDRQELYADAMVVLAFSCVVVLTFAWVAGGWYLSGLEHDRALLTMAQEYY